MKIYKVVLLLLFIGVINGCGVKAPPIPKDSINIPIPVKVNVSINDEGILVSNEQDNISVVVERAIVEENIFYRKIYKRIALIQPNKTYLDKSVVDGMSYTYRFKNYNAEYKTFSSPTVRNITYNMPIKISSVKTTEKDDTVCLNIKLNDATKYADIIINSKNVDRINKSKNKCYPLPSSLNISIIVLPYDDEEITGIAYETTIIRDSKKVLLPPQNIKAYRDDTSVVLSWDTNKNVDEYNIYVKENDKFKLVGTTSVTLFKYNIDDDQNCVDFELSSVSKNRESSKIQVTSCP